MEPAAPLPPAPPARTFLPAIGTLLFAVIFGMALAVFCLYFWGAQVEKERSVQQAQDATLHS